MQAFFAFVHFFTSYAR